MTGRRRSAALALATTLVLCSAAPSAADPRPARAVALETDGARRALGIDNPRPRLGWRLRPGHRGARQTAYRVLAASSRRDLTPGRADVWDSGRVRSSRPWADFAGRRLRSRRRYFWTVRVWDERGRAGPFAPATWMETAFMRPAEWRAEWIAGPRRSDAGGADGVLDDAEGLLEGEFCRPVGVGGALALLSEREREEYLSGLHGLCRAPRPAPLLRREFSPPGRVEDARLYVSGLGYAEVRLNGERLGRRAVLDPGYTDYAETALYVTYDITRLLRPGRNALGVELGSGFFDYDVSSEWGWTRTDWRGDPRLRLELHAELADGSSWALRSDGRWRAVEGPTRYDNINVGETFDARRAQPGWDEPGFDDSGWPAAREVGPPGGRQVAQVHEPISLVRTLEPVKVTTPLPGVRVYDFGRQVSGWGQVEVEAERGQAAQITYAESLLPTGTVDTLRNLHIADQIQTDYLVGDGEGAVRWHPRFSYKGFRYVQVSGPLGLPFTGRVDDVRVQQVRSAVRRTARFHTDNRLINGIYRLVRRAIGNNLHGIVTDTPTYEKNGWTGDAQLTAPTAATMFDLRRFYAKWLRDVRDSQRPSGEIPVIVPAGGQYGYTGAGWEDTWGPTPAWDAALFLIPWTVYERYGDARPALSSYPAMRRYIDRWIPRWAQEGIVSSPLGDHLSPASADGIGLVAGGAGLPKLVATAYYAEMTRVLARVARLAGDARRGARYRSLRAEIRRAFNAAFLDRDAGVYRESPGDGFLQTANVLPLAFGLVPKRQRDRVIEALAADVRANGGNLATGIVGTRYILKALTEAGLIDLAFGIATQTDNPSWGEWLELGYTSLPENWGSTIRSRDHHMFGSIGQWLYEDLAGIEPLRPGYERIEYRPEIPSSGLGRVRMSLLTERGRAAIAWRRSDDGLALRVTVPPNASGRVLVPAARPGLVKRSPRRGRHAPGLIGRAPGRAIYRVSSGTYSFRVGRPSG